MMAEKIRMRRPPDAEPAKAATDAKPRTRRGVRPLPAVRAVVRSPLVFTAAVSIALALPGNASAQALSRAEKLEARLRTAMLKANKDIKGPWIKAAELKASLEDTNLILVDVRQPAEQRVSMIPHAIDTYRFADFYRRGIPPGKRLVLYCTIGFRSGKYGERLAGMGIKSEILEGGILMWSFVGGPLVAPSQDTKAEPTNRIHVYDAEWNIVHPDYVGVAP